MSTQKQPGNDAFFHASVKRLDGASLQSIELRDYTWVFIFGEGLWIATEAKWRMHDAVRTVAGSDDHGQWFGLPAPFDVVATAQSMLEQQIVSAAEIVRPTGDLILRFGNGITVEFLQLSSGYESWRLWADGGEIVCLGGGEIG